MLRRICALALAAVLTGGLLAPDPTSAHPVSTYFPYNAIAGTTAWPFGSMTVQFNSSFPNSQTWRDRVQEAHANWPQSLGRPPVYFAMASTNWQFQFPCNQGDNVNGVFYWNLENPNDPINDPGPVARTYTCRSYGHWNMQMVFNTRRPFHPYDYFGTNVNYDLEGIATHEFAHAYGWVGNQHFSNQSDPSLCQVPVNLPARSTMCDSSPTGWYQQRTPKTHDLHTLDAGF